MIDVCLRVLNVQTRIAVSPPNSYPNHKVGSIVSVYCDCQKLFERVIAFWWNLGNINVTIEWRYSYDDFRYWGVIGPVTACAGIPMDIPSFTRWLQTVTWIEMFLDIRLSRTVALRIPAFLNDTACGDVTAMVWMLCGAKYISLKEGHMDAVCASLCVPLHSRVSSTKQRISVEFGVGISKYWLVLVCWV